MMGLHIKRHIWLRIKLCGIFASAILCFILLLDTTFYLHKKAEYTVITIKKRQTDDKQRPATHQTTKHSTTTISPSCKHQTSNSSAKKYLLTMGYMGQLGNNMFQYASLLGLAKKNRRTPFIRTGSPLTHTFRITNIKYVSHPEKWRPVIHESGFGKYDTRLNCLPPGNLLIRAYLQSYKYFSNMKEIVLSEFSFLPHIMKKRDMIFETLLPQKLRQNSTIIGVHVRRGDRLHKQQEVQGDLVAPLSYFKKALDFMRKKYPNSHFVVASDDMLWSRNNLNASDVDFLPKAFGNVHLSLLAKCDHMIMSEGTFGWWAGFLAGGDVIYYNHPEVDGSLKAKNLNMDDYYPKQWIPLGE